MYKYSNVPYTIPLPELVRKIRPNLLLIKKKIQILINFKTLFELIIDIFNIEILFGAVSTTKYIKYKTIYYI